MRIIRKCSALFKDDSGKVVIAQRPNLPVLTWATAELLLLFSWNSTVLVLLEAISFGALFTWAWLEVFLGVNWFRRILGLVIFAYLLFGKTL